MTLAELRSLYRRMAGDTVKPYLCSDEAVDFWANEAEVEACRRAHILVDSVSDASQLFLNAGDSVLELDDRVIAIRRARLVNGNRNLRFIVLRDMDDRFPGWENATPSTPLVLIPDYQSGAVALYPPSGVQDTVRMTVVRTPMSRMTEDEHCPEIPQRYHAALVHYILSEAYNTQDADLFDAKKAEKHALLFAAEFGPKVTATNERWALEQYYDIGEF